MHDVIGHPQGDSPHDPDVLPALSLLTLVPFLIMPHPHVQDKESMRNNPEAVRPLLPFPAQKSVAHTALPTGLLISMKYVKKLINYEILKS